MITPSSTSQSTFSLTDGSTRSSRAPIKVSANLANSVGYAGSSRPVSSDVRPVVQPDADDLAGPRDERSEVGFRRRHRRRARPRPRLAACREQLAHVGGVQRNENVPVKPRRSGPVIHPMVANRIAPRIACPLRGPGSRAGQPAEEDQT